MDGIYYNIVDNLPYSLFALDNSGKIILWNKEIEKLTGVKKENAIGKGDFEYSYIIYGQRTPGLVDVLRGYDEAKKYYKNLTYYENAISGERIIPGTDTVLYCWTNKIFNNVDTILGEYIIVKNIEDITLEKETRKNFKLIFHENPVPMCIIDYETGVYVETNDSFKKYLLSNDVIGEQIKCDNITMGDINEITKMLKETGEVDNYKINYKKNGKTKYVVISCNLISFNNRKCVLSTIFDVTKNRELENNLMRIKNDYNNKIKKYIETQNEIFCNMMKKHNVDIKDNIKKSHELIQTLIMEG
jgi:PAS domain S-box-containing protein